MDLVHEIHVSELRSYRGCRLRWHWLFEENRQPLVTPAPLEFGVAFHRAMEVLYDPTTWHLDKYALGVRAESAFIEKCKEQRANFLRVTEKYGLSDEEEKDYEESFELGIGMIRWYVNNHLPQAEFTATAVEVKFRVGVQDEEGNQLFCKCQRCWSKYQSARKTSIDPDSFAPFHLWEGLPVVYEGRIDAIVRDQHGGFWILDWKTTIRMMAEDSDVILEIDDQVASYCWAIRVQLGLNIRGFKYVELRKGFPEPPTQNKNLRLGRSFSVSKSADTDYSTFLETVRTKDTAAYAAGLYDEYLDWLRTSGTQYIQVHTVHKPPQTLASVGHEIFLQAREMISAPVIYRNPGRMTCGRCAFQGPCIDRTAGRDFEYAIQTMFEVKPRYYELQESSTDRRV